MRNMYRFILVLAALATFLVAASSSASLGRQGPRAGAFSTTLPFAEEVYDVAVQNNYAYVAAGQRLVAVDISNPVRTIVMGQSEPTPAWRIHTVAVAGSYAYVADAFGNLIIIDIENPQFLRTVSLRWFFYSAQDIAIRNGYAYVADANRLIIIDITDSVNPKEVGRLEGLGDLIHIDVAEHPDQPRRVYAYITAVPVPGPIGSDPEGNAFAIIDVTDPTQPNKVYAYGGGGGGGDGPYDVAVMGRYAYVTVSHPSGLVPGLNVLDVTDPARPQIAGFLQLPTGTYNLALQDDWAFMTSEEVLLYEVEVNDVAQMRAQAQRALAAPGREVRLAAANGCVYAAMRVHGLQITCSSVVTPTPPPLVWLPLWVTPAG